MLIASPLCGQIIRHGRLLEARYPTFEPSEVAERGIARITVRLMRKPSSKTIYDDGRRLIYHFDAQGELQSCQKVNPGNYGTSDTVGTTWIRMNDELKAQAEQIGKYRRRITFEYPNDSTTIETVKVKRGPMEWQELTREQVTLKTRQSNGKRIEIELRGGVDATPYQRTIRTYGPHGIESEERWLGARVGYIDTWTYENELIGAFEHQEGNQASTFRLTYDTSNGKQEEGQWCEGDGCRNWSMVYYENGLPKGWIIIDPSTQDLEIWEFRYDYR